MSNDEVIFPNHAENIRFSWRTRYFFLSHKIAIKTGTIFPLDLLRDEIRHNDVLGMLLFQELYLFGFNFHSEEPLPLYPPDVLNKDRVLLSLDKGPFLFGRVRNKKLRKIFRDLDVMVNSDLNGMSYERLLSFTNIRFLAQKIEELGYAIEPWDNLAMERIGSTFLYWPEGREGLATPNFFLPFLSDLMSADIKLISLYRRVGLKRYGDFFHLNFGRVEFIGRLIAKQGMDPYEASLHQVALWTFVYELEEARRQLNEVNLDDRFLFYPIAKGHGEEEVAVLKKYLAVNIPFGRDLVLANAYNYKDLPTSLKGEAERLNNLEIRDLTIFTSEILNKTIDTYRVNGSPYLYALSPEFVFHGVLDSLLDLSEPHLVTYNALDLTTKVDHYLAHNEPEKALDVLFDSKPYLPQSALRKIPGILAYIQSGEGKYALDKDIKVVGLKDSLDTLAKRKERLFVRKSYVSFEAVKDFYQNSGVSPLRHLREIGYLNTDYDPFPIVMKGKKKIEKAAKAG